MGTKLKAMREASGMSQSQFAKKTGIHYRTLQHYEQGVISFDHARMDKIVSAAVVLGCNIEDIVEDPAVIKIIKKYQDSL